jgi:predicted nucleotidyltransferase
MTTTDSTAAARAVADECARAYQDAFADRLVAAYLLGSLAYGGYAPAVSDIDLAVVLADVRDSDSETIADTIENLRGQGRLYQKLSIFWSSRIR